MSQKMNKEIAIALQKTVDQVLKFLAITLTKSISEIRDDEDPDHQDSCEACASVLDDPQRLLVLAHKVVLRELFKQWDPDQNPLMASYFAYSNLHGEDPSKDAHSQVSRHVLSLNHPELALALAKTCAKGGLSSEEKKLVEDLFGPITEEQFDPITGIGSFRTGAPKSPPSLDDDLEEQHGDHSS